MNYPPKEELNQYENWAETKLAPRMVEAMKLQRGRLVENIDFLEKGLRIVKWLGRARNVQKEINHYDNRNSTIEIQTSESQ